ncbi:MAG: hypothetical protein IPP50_20810 [Piscinibacter sp.]|nr:hypothetical protein [Piscinibacter sp.]
MKRPHESVVDGSKALPKDLPSVDRLLRSPAVSELVAEHGHTLVAEQARALLDAAPARHWPGRRRCTGRP